VNDHTHIGVTSLQRIRNPRQHVVIAKISVIIYVQHFFSLTHLYRRKRNHRLKVLVH